MFFLHGLALSSTYALFDLSGGSKAASSDRGKKVAEEEDVDIEADSSDEAFVPDWSVKRGTRMNNANFCRDMMIHLATPGEEKFLDAHDDEKAINRSWLFLGKTSTAVADVLFRYENLR